MLDVDRWNEVFSSLRHSKLRTALTAFGVFWGMLMLVVMLGFGNGLELGVQTKMMGFANNSVYVWGRQTALSFGGYKRGRRIKFTLEDVEPLLLLPGVVSVSPRAEPPGGGEVQVSYDGQTAGFRVVGDVAEVAVAENIVPYAGRFLNQLDVSERRKVAVIGQQVRHMLFGKGEPIGKFITIDGVIFQVVGAFSSDRPGGEGERNNSSIHVPLSTLQTAFGLGKRIDWLAVGAGSGVDAEELEQSIRRLLAGRHTFDPKDRRAIGTFNGAKGVGKMRRLFSGMAFFTWVVSLATLLAGILGVSNVMLISVKERTREFGVRKALGATPMSVITLVLQEALVLTALAGYSGLMAGVALLEGSGQLAAKGEGPLAAPSIDLMTAVIAASILIATGLIAGIVPAAHAASIRPVEALRAE